MQAEREGRVRVRTEKCRGRFVIHDDQNVIWERSSFAETTASLAFDPSLYHPSISCRPIQKTRNHMHAFIRQKSHHSTVSKPPKAASQPYLVSFTTNASNAFWFAPTTSPTFSPFLNTRNVGMARTPSSCATSGSSSTSSL